MHGFDDLPPASAAGATNGPWHRELNRYHWFVLVVAAAEVVVGLAIIVAIFRRRQSASVDELSEMAG